MLTLTWVLFASRAFSGRLGRLLLGCRDFIKGNQSEALHVALEVDLQPRAQQHHLVPMQGEVQLAVLLRGDAQERRPRQRPAPTLLMLLEYKKWPSTSIPDRIYLRCTRYKSRCKILTHLT